MTYEGLAGATSSGSRSDRSRDADGGQRTDSTSKPSAVLSPSGAGATQSPQDNTGQAVLVSGHSNTIPAIIKELGVTEEVKIADRDYDNLFVVTIEGGKARLTRLHYGAGNQAE